MLHTRSGEYALGFGRPPGMRQHRAARRSLTEGESTGCCDIYAHYACVADCADAMADAWEDTASCAHADCLHGNILK